ncbi:hypothetical protein GA0115254_115549 [Streptomyces sp. Ncost-T10-10d]|nr:hypothetical protein GA0115254_115549 [Streptomyces sp. Ncost-T10-10d]
MPVEALGVDFRWIEVAGVAPSPRSRCSFLKPSRRAGGILRSASRLAIHAGVGNACRITTHSASLMSVP